MRVVGAAVWPGRHKAVDQREQSIPLYCQIPLILHFEPLDRRGIPPHGLVVLENHHLDNTPDNPPQELPRRSYVS